MDGFLHFLEEFALSSPVYFAAAVVIIVALISKYLKNKRGKYPPGPWGVPILGYLPFLTELEHLDFHKLQKKYGKIFSLKMGMRSAVVLGDFQLIKEAFNKDEISERPPRIFETPNPNIKHFVELVEREWKESRRFALTVLRNLGMGKNKLEGVIKEEIGSLVEQTRSLTGSDVNIHDMVNPTVSSIIISLICGKTLKGDTKFSEIVVSYTKAFFPYMRIKAFLCFVPILRPFVSFLHPEVKALDKDMTNLEERIWKEIKLVEDNRDGPGTEHYMGQFVTEMRNAASKGTTFTREILNGNSQLLLTAGLETTIRSIEWTLLLMAEYPEVQERVYQEIVEVIGKERPPNWNEREDLPYLDAVLAEVARFKTLGPLADPHWTICDTKIGEYDIPKDTVVFGNLYAVHMDPDLWEEPEKFNPDRFLTKDGKRIKDPEYFIPFSIGKRICPGEKIAKVETFLFACSLLQHFKFYPPSSGINMEGVLQIAYRAKYPVLGVQARD